MENTFEVVFDYLMSLSEPVPGFKTAGAELEFSIEAREVHISIPRPDRRAIVARTGQTTRIYIFEGDWKSSENSFGTRMYLYTEPINAWYSTVRQSQDIGLIKGEL
jgi:hypothetical protein